MSKTYSKHEISILSLGAVGAGFLNGLLGAGGGIILYFTLGALFGKGAKENLIVSSFAVMFFCVISLFFYKGNAALSAESIMRICIPSSAGGLTGALLLKKLSTESVKKLFAVVIIMSGILMILR